MTPRLRQKQEQRRGRWGQGGPSNNQEPVLSTERSLDAEGDPDAILLLGVFQDGDHNFWSVVDGQDDFINTGLYKQESAYV